MFKLILDLQLICDSRLHHLLSLWSIFPSLREPHVMGHSTWIPTLFGFSRICCQLGPTCIRIGPQRGRVAKSGGHPWPWHHLLLTALCFTGASAWPEANTLLVPSAQSCLLPSVHWLWTSQVPLGLTDRQQRRWTDCSDDGGWSTFVQAPGGPATH